MGEPPAVASTAGPPEVVRTRVRPVAGQPGSVPYDASLIFALTHCVGHKVVVQTKTGSEFEGILHTPGLKNADIHIVLRKARNLKSERGPATGEVFERLIIKSGELVQLQAKDLPEVGAAASSAAADHSGNRHVVLKDGALKEEAFSGDRSRTKNWDGAGLYGRQLEKWEPDEDDTAMGLEDESSHETGKWDQFKANEKLFGVRTNFNMELYTAKLDASKSRFSVAEAEKLAREIAKDPTARNMLTDGQKVHVDDSGIDEETLFSAVNVAPSESGQSSSQLEAIREGTSASKDNSVPTDNPPVEPVEPQNQGKVRSDPIPMPSSQPQSKLRELGKVRQHLASEKKSTYGSPLATSPLVKDAKNMEALNLTPGAPKPLGIQVTQDFKKFKETLAKSNQVQQQQKQAPVRSLKDKELFNELKNFSTTFRIPVPKENKEAAAAAKSALNRLPSGPIKVESQIPAPVTTQRPVTPVADTFSGGPKTPGQGGSHARRPKTPVDEAHSRRGKLPGQETYSRKVQSQDPHMGRPKPLIQSQHQSMHQPHSQGPTHRPPQMQPHSQPHPQTHPQPLQHSQPHPHAHARHQDPMQGRTRSHPHDVPLRNRGPGHDSYAVRAKAGLPERETGRSKAPVPEGYKRAKTPIQDMNPGRAKTPVQEAYPRRARSPAQDPHTGPVKMPVPEAYGRPRTPVQDANMTHPRGQTQPRHPVHEVWSGRHSRRPGPSTMPSTSASGPRSGPPTVRPSLPPGSVHPGPVHPGSVHPGSVHPGPVHPGSVHPGSVHPGPVHPGSVHPGPVHPGSVHPGPHVMPPVSYMIPSPMPQPGPPSNRMGQMSPRHEHDLSDSSDPMANARRSLNPYAQPFVPGGPPGSEDAGGGQQQDQKGRGNRPRSEMSMDMSVSNGQSSPIPAAIGSPEAQRVQHLPPPPPPPPPKMGQGMEPAQAPVVHRAPPRPRKNTEKVVAPVQHPPDMHPPPPNHMVMSGPMPIPPNAMPMGPPYPGIPGHGPNPGPESERPPMHPMHYIPYPMGPMPGMPPMNQPPPPNMVGPPYPYPPHPGMPMFAPMPMIGPNGPMMPHPYPMMPPHMMPPTHPPSYPHTARPTRPRVSMKTSRRPLQRHNSGQSTHSVHSAHSVPSSHGGPPRG